MKSLKPSAVAYSYIRFSQASQAKGDSVRRQTELAESWCRLNSVRLDPSTFQDLGVSAYSGEHRTNPDRHGLALFLLAVEKKKVKPGDYLLVENLDRLSREHVMTALALLLQLVNAGVRVVQLAPTATVFDKNSEPMSLMMAVMELSRGNSESRMKSERCGKAWRQKKELARANKTPTTNMLPGWIHQVDGKLKVKPEAGKAVKRIYELSANGMGHVAVSRKLAEEGHKPFGKNNVWTRSYIAGILSTRRVLGEYQPIVKKTGQPDGEVIPNYYPAVVSEELFYQAQAGKKQRDGTSGRKGKNFNYFTGLMVRLEDHNDKFFTHTCVETKKNRRLVVYNTAKGNDGRAKPAKFSQEIFDSCFFNYFKDLSPKEVLGNDTTNDELASVSAELEELEAMIETLTNELEDGGEVQAGVKVLRKWEAKADELRTIQTELRQKAATPRAEAFGETQHLLSAILWENRDQDSEEMKHRLRSCLKRVIDKIYCSFWGTRHRRLAVAQITFHDSDAIRLLAIDYTPRRSSGHHTTIPAKWDVWYKELDKLMTTAQVEKLFDE